jgi:enamine deaminase RidA (YjgF/YER057c/UK114 family)
MLTITQRLQELGEAMPDVSNPVANYVSIRRWGPLLVISGQIAQNEARPAFFGRVGAELDVETGYLAAKSAGLALVAQIAIETDGLIERVAAVLQLRVFVASAPEFTAHSRVADGASDVLTAVFGEAGQHARTAVGVASLPAGVAVEIDAIIALSV